MKSRFNYKGFEILITRQENAASATAFKNGEPFCSAFIHLDKISIEDKIKQKIDEKLK